MRYVLMSGEVAIEILPPSDTPLAERFHPDIVAMIREAPDDVKVGYIWNGSEFDPPSDPGTEPPPVPASISATQFWLELPNWVAVTQAEALAGARGAALPEAIENALVGLPSDDAFEARVRLARMGDVLRYDPLTIATAASLGKTEAELDDFFRAAVLR